MVSGDQTLLRACAWQSLGKPRLPLPWRPGGRAGLTSASTAVCAELGCRQQGPLSARNQSGTSARARAPRQREWGTAHWGETGHQTRQAWARLDLCSGPQEAQPKSRQTWQPAWYPSVTECPTGQAARTMVKRLDMALPSEDSHSNGQRGCYMTSREGVSNPGGAKESRGNVAGFNAALPQLPLLGPNPHLSQLLSQGGQQHGLARQVSLASGKWHTGPLTGRGRPGRAP